MTAARKFVSDTDSQLKSRLDAIEESKKQIAQALQAFGVSERTDLPTKQQLEEERAATNKERDEIISKLSQAETLLDTHYANIRKLRDIEAQLIEAKKSFARWDKLNSIFGGTRFRTLVQTYILRPLLNNANIYLEQITDRYRLTCSEDNEQLKLFRLVLSANVAKVIRLAMSLLGIEVPERM